MMQISLVHYSHITVDSLSTRLCMQSLPLTCTEYSALLCASVPYSTLLLNSLQICTPYVLQSRILHASFHVSMLYTVATHRSHTQPEKRKRVQASMALAQPSPPTSTGDLLFPVLLVADCCHTSHSRALSLCRLGPIRPFRQANMTSPATLAWKLYPFCFFFFSSLFLKFFTFFFVIVQFPPGP